MHFIKLFFNWKVLIFHEGMDSILPNKEPYRPKINQKTTIVFGKPIYFDELVKELKTKHKTSVKNIKFINWSIKYNELNFYLIVKDGNSKAYN